MYDTFISYRRVGGDHIAARVYDYLRLKGYSPFYDITGMSAGRFDEQLLRHLSNSLNYILILSPQRIVLGGGVMHQEQLFPLVRQKTVELLNGYVLTKEIDNLKALMKQAANILDFETAIKLRDEINELKKMKD